VNPRNNSFPLTGVFKSRAQSPALIDQSEHITWIELHKNMLRMSRALSKQGLVSGDKCAILAQPGKDYICLLLSLWANGIVAAPMNTRQPSTVIKKQLESINCRNLIVGDEFKGNLGESTKILSLSDICHMAQKSTIGATHINITFNQPATIIFTSGSSGKGKACLHTFGNHYFNALGSDENILLEENDSWLLSLPLFHVAGLGILFRCLLSGAAIALPSDTHSHFVMIQILQPTHISLVATQLQQLLDDRSVLKHLRSMKAILLGGSAIPAKLIQRAVDLDLSIYTSYGSTEMASQTTTSAPQDSLGRLLKSGQLLPYREIEINAAGEILVRGACLGAGYIFGDRIETLIDSDGWFHSGDSGFLDDEGYLQVNGRLDAMFISGGENIHPEEIEKEMLQLKCVQEVVVAPISDAAFGQRPIAFVKLKSGYELNDLKLDELEEVLPKYKIPMHVYPWPENDSAPGIKMKRQVFQKLAKQMSNAKTD
jgi:o-succinylbenzoate---CoA ligase